MDYLTPLSNILLAPLRYFTDPGSRAFGLYLGTSVLIALIIHFKQSREGNEDKGIAEGIFPKQVYTHSSAMVDYIYLPLNAILYAIILAPFMGLSVFVSRHLQAALGAAWSPYVMTDLSPLWTTIIFSLALALIADFGMFITHYWMHRLPILWEFHKVHHSAEVLTPLTVYRMHPLDDIITVSVVGILTGIADAVARFFVSPAISVYAVYGLGVATYLFFLTGYHLRHSHIWLSYGPFLSTILISPAQHQIHHSKAKRHWDKNFGFIFAIWDYIFGSLYVPKQKETIEFGIGNGEERLYSSPLKLYLLPFKRALHIVRKMTPYPTERSPQKPTKHS